MSLPWGSSSHVITIYSIVKKRVLLLKVQHIVLVVLLAGDTTPGWLLHIVRVFASAWWPAFTQIISVLIILAVIIRLLIWQSLIIVTVFLLAVSSSDSVIISIFLPFLLAFASVVAVVFGRLVLVKVFVVLKVLVALLSHVSGMVDDPVSTIGQLVVIVSVAPTACCTTTWHLIFCLWLI